MRGLDYIGIDVLLQDSNAIFYALYIIYLFFLCLLFIVSRTKQESVV